VLDASQSVLSSIQLVKKIYFPREILPLATIISNFIHLMLGFVVFFLLLIVNYIIRPGSFPIQATTIYLPILLVISFMLATGLGLIVCALNTFYEDVKYMMGVFMYMLLFLCPVMYFIEEVANAGPVKAHPIYFKLYNLNPVAVLTTAYRKILLAPQYIRMRDGSKAHPFPLEWSWVGYAAVLSFLVLIGGYAVFNRVKWKFVERP
jgi:ABC-2 type transport system permease protein